MKHTDENAQSTDDTNTGNACEDTDLKGQNKNQHDDNDNGQGNVSLSMGATRFQQQLPLQQQACSDLNQSRQNHEQASTLTRNDDDGSTVCGICLENVVEKGRRFALFSNCIHPFCYECARSWHRDNQYRNSLKSNGFDVECQLIYHSCPVCRIESEFIFPSRDYKTGPDKEAFIALYKQERLGRPCKFFKGEIGTCPFGKECFYAHLSPEGKDLKPIDIKKPKGKSNVQLERSQDLEDELDRSNHNEHIDTLLVQDGVEELDFFDIIESQEEAMMPSATLLHGNAFFLAETDHAVMEECQVDHDISTSFQPVALSSDNFTIPNMNNELNIQIEGDLKENIGSTWWGKATTTATTSMTTETLTNQHGYHSDQQTMLGNLSTTNLLSPLWESSAWQSFNRYEMRPGQDHEGQTESLARPTETSWFPSLNSVSATNSETTRVDEDSQTSLIMDLAKIME